MLDMMGACAGDISNGSTVSVASMYGSTHTYIAVTDASTGYNQGFATSLNGIPVGSVYQKMALLMRYE